MLACQQAVDTRGNYIVIAELTCFNQRAADGRRDKFLSPVIDNAAGDAARQIEDRFQGSADNSIAFTRMCVEITQRYQQVVLFYTVAGQVRFDLTQYTLGALLAFVGKQVREQRCFVRMRQPKIEKPRPNVYIKLHCQVAQLVIEFIILD